MKNHEIEEQILKCLYYVDHYLTSTSGEIAESYTVVNTLLRAQARLWCELQDQQAANKKMQDYLSELKNSTCFGGCVDDVKTRISKKLDEYTKNELSKIVHSAQYVGQLMQHAVKNA